MVTPPEDTPDYTGKVADLFAVTPLPRDHHPYFGFSLGLPSEKTFYVDLYDTDLQARINAQAIVAVVTAAFVSRVGLRVFLDGSGADIVKWVQTDAVY